MHNINFFFHCLFILASAFMFSGLCTLPARAQNEPGNLRFLEAFAIQTFEQGNIHQSTKEFERILLIDPSNQTARDYLARTAKGLAPRLKTDDQSLSILADLSYLRKEARSREAEFKELTGLIRGLVTENDQLYMSLHKRTREVMELREKLFGQTYSEQYSTETAGLQPERVPQNLQRAGEILKELEQRQPLASAEEADQTSVAQDPKLLDAQLNLMVRQNASAASDIEQLNQLKSSLARINTELKNSENATIAAVDRIEKYFGELRSKVNYRDPRQENEIGAIKTELTQRTADLKQLHDNIASKDQSLETLKDRLAQSNADVAGLNEEISRLKNETATLRQSLSAEKEARIRDHEILSLRGQEIGMLKGKNAKLANHNQQLSAQNEQKRVQMNEKDAAITRQQSDLALVYRKLSDINLELSAAEASLDTGERELAELSREMKKVSPAGAQKR